MIDNPPRAMEATEFEDEPGITLGEVIAGLREHLKLLTLGPLAAGLLARGVAFIIPPTFTARTAFLPPQQAQGGAASALASLGALAGLAGGAAGVSSPGERYVALMQSTNVAESLIEQFKLMEVYEAKFRVDARTELARNVRISLGKKDGLITVEVDDKDPQRAAAIANSYVDELRRLTGTLAVTEAQQRRAFFGSQEAYLSTAVFQHETMQLSQRENLCLVPLDTETELVRESTTQCIATSEMTAGAIGRAAAALRLIVGLRSLQPTGGMVFQIAPSPTALLDIRREDGDRPPISPIPSTTGAVGNVFNVGGCYGPSRAVDARLRLGRGPIKVAARNRVVGVRSNRQVVNILQRASWAWFNRGNQIASVRAEPGATVFVPEEFNKLRFIRAAKDWAQIMYQFGIGIAGITALTR